MNLTVEQPIKFDLIIKPKIEAARLTPKSVLLRADEVIQ
mgnify:CR=1 FL=1